MITSSLIVSSPYVQAGRREHCYAAWRWGVKVLNHHTDLIHNLGILAITTCLLVSKIFERIPRILPRLAKVVFDFGGVLWLNVQVRDLLKSARDLQSAMARRNAAALIETAAKVAYKAINVILTCAIFSGSVIAACGFPQTAFALAMAIRPIGLAALALNVATDIRDYFVNNAIIKRLHKIEDSPNASDLIGRVMVCFLETILHCKSRYSRHWLEERLLAECLVRQLDEPTLRIFHEIFIEKKERTDPRQEAFKLYYSLVDGMKNKQAITEANLSLIALGYASMGICRLFPDSLMEMSARFGMSILYTDELIRQKLFQHDILSRSK